MHHLQAQAEAGAIERPEGPASSPSPTQGAPWFWPLLLLGLATWVLLLGQASSHPPFPYFDEIHNARAAQQYAAGLVVDERSHPPLYKLMEAWALRWRLPAGTGPMQAEWALLAEAIRWPSVLCSAGALLGMALVGRSLQGPAAGLALAFLLACDPVFLIFGHTAMNAGPALGFALLGLAACLSALRQGRLGLWAASGMLFGLALACRWTAAFPWAACGALILLASLRPSPAGWRAFGPEGPRPWVAALVFTLPVPGVYFLCHLPLLGALAPQAGLGGWLSLCWELQVTAYQAHSAYVAPHMSSCPWYSWPFQDKATSFYFALSPDKQSVQAIAAVGTPWTWALAPLLLPLGLWSAWRQGQWPMAAAILPGPLLVAAWANHGQRVGFNHYFLEAMPYALIAGLACWSWFWSLGAARTTQRRLGASAILLASLAFALWMWPLATARPLGVDAYIARLWRPGWDAATQLMWFRSQGHTPSPQDLHLRDQDFRAPASPQPKAEAVPSPSR